MAMVTSSNQPESMATMPQDILLEIFSHLDQQDALTCLDVCSSWYYAIQVNAHKIWKSVRFTEKDINRDVLCGKMGLVKRIKRVTFESSAPFKPFPPYVLRGMMYRLRDWNCTELESLEFIACETVRHFIDMLKQLGRRLTHIKMVDHRSIVSFTELILACPELTHFSCQQPDSSARCLIYREHDADPVDYLSKITYLQLDAIIFQSNLDRILEHCPNLRCAIIASRVESRSTKSAYVKLDSLSVWCPNLTTLVSTNRALSKLKMAYSYSEDDDKSTGLRCFIADRPVGHDQFNRYLSNNQDTLEHLFIGYQGYNRDLSTALLPLQMPQLRKLICYTYVAASSLTAMIKYSPALELLEVKDPHIMFDSTVVRLLKQLPCLTRLALTSVILDEELMVFLEKFPALEELVLERMKISTAVRNDLPYPSRLTQLKLSGIAWKHHGNLEVEVAYLLGRLAAGGKLTTVYLSDMGSIGEQPLEVIMAIPTLKYLGIPLMVVDQERYIKMLSVVEELSLYSTPSLSLPALVALSDLPRLKKLEVLEDNNNPTFISKEGLLHMLYKSSSLKTVSLMRVKIEDNNALLSYDNFVAAIKQQHFQNKVAGYEYKSPISSQAPRILCRVVISCARF